MNILFSQAVGLELRAFYFGHWDRGGRGGKRGPKGTIVQRSCKIVHDTCSGAVSIDLGPQMAADRVPSRRARPSAKGFWLPDSRSQLGSFGTMVYTCSGAVSIDLGSQMAAEGVPSHAPGLRPWHSGHRSYEGS